MRVELHVFGSFKGYSTLARSPGVSMEDARQLEAGAYNFGQPADARYAATLAKQPAWFTRVLSGQRRGLTRVLEGKPDDNGRPTLELVTAIVSQADWDGVLWGDPSLLLANRRVWAWERAEVPAMEIEPGAPTRQVSARAVPRLFALLSEVERCLPARRPIIVDPTDYSADDLAILEMLIPPAARRFCTTGVRTLSASLPVSVNYPASESVARATFRYDPNALQPSPYASHLGQTEFAHGAIPLAAISDYQYFGTTRAAAVTMDSAPAPASAAVLAPRRTPMWPVALVAVLGLLFAAAAFLAGRHLASATASKDARHDDAPGTQSPLVTVTATHADPDSTVPATQPTISRDVASELQRLRATTTQQAALLEEAHKKIAADAKAGERQKHLTDVFEKREQNRFEKHLTDTVRPFFAKVTSAEKLKVMEKDVTAISDRLKGFEQEALTEDQQRVLSRVEQDLKALEYFRKERDTWVKADTECEHIEGDWAKAKQDDKDRFKTKLAELKDATKGAMSTISILSGLEPKTLISKDLFDDIDREIRASQTGIDRKIERYEKLLESQKG